jgi:predicted RNA-binding Zn-ribbon protein involved in translation (DUF1610 family)
VCAATLHSPRGAVTIACVMPPVTWSCPNCGRRVPLRVAQCHCGTTREDAEQAAARVPVLEGGVSRPRSRPSGPPLRIGPLTWDQKALVIAIVVVALLGLVRLFWPSKPEPLVPVLGYVNPAPTPKPKPTPTPQGWKLPWK